MSNGGINKSSQIVLKNNKREKITDTDSRFTMVVSIESIPLEVFFDDNQIM